MRANRKTTEKKRTEGGKKEKGGDTLGEGITAKRGGVSIRLTKDGERRRSSEGREVED